MIRPTTSPELIRLPARLAALGIACAITAVLVLVHAVDLGALGGHDVVTAAAGPTLVARAPTDMPHVDAAD